MNMTMKSAMAAIALAAGMLASSAQAAVIALPDIIDDGSADISNGFGAAGSFTDRFEFTTQGDLYISDAYIHSTYSKLHFTSFAIYNSGGTLIGTAGHESADAYGTALIPGTHTGFWTFANVSLAANTSYYVEVKGDILSANGSVYGGTLNVSVVPEPETYALMLAGLGMLGLVRRRKQ